MSTATVQEILDAMKAAGFASAAESVHGRVSLYAPQSDAVILAADAADDLNCWLAVSLSPGIYYVIPRAD